MSAKLREELAKLKSAFTIIDGCAHAIDADTRNTPDARSKARHILRKSEEIYGQLEQIFKVKADPNGGLGAVSDCERIGNGN